MKSLWGICCGAVAAVVITSSIHAQAPASDEEIWSAGRLAAPELEITDAVEIALRSAPELAIDRTGVDLQQGRVLEEQGLFDPTMFGSLDFTYQQTELGRGAKEGQKERRQAIRDQLEGFFEDRDSTAALLDALREIDPENPFIDLEDPEAKQIQFQLELLNALINRSEGEQRDRFVDLRDQYLAGNITDLEATLATIDEQITTESERLRKLGLIASVEEQFNGSLTLGLDKLFRVGVRATTTFDYTGSGVAWVGKSEKDSELGGPGIQDRYTAKGTVGLNLPLLRGGGYKSTTAAERASLSDLDAASLSSVHSASVTALTTALAYWNLVAAQERLTALEQSERLQLRISDLTSALVDGDELPRTELNRVRASSSESGVSVRGAARSLYEQRVELARVMGLEVSGPEDIPIAVTDFPVPPPREAIKPGDFAEARGMAEANRADFKASDQLVESREILLEAAGLDRRALLNADLRTWYLAVGQAWSFEDGFRDTVNKWSGPSFSVDLTFERPFRNDLWNGRYLQQQALHRRQMISTRDLRRVTQAEIVTLLLDIDLAAEQVRQSQTLLDLYDGLLQAEIEKLQLGSSTLIDVLLTEQRLTQVALQYVSARYDYAVLLSRLRFATGTLVERNEEGYLVDRASLMTLPTGIRD